MKKSLIIFLPIIFFLSCQKGDAILQGGWIIEKAYYNDKFVKYDLSTNAFDLHIDHSCTLPFSSAMIDSVSDKGVWSCYKNKDTLFLKIKTSNSIFNRTFKVSNYTIDQKPGFSPIIKTTLIADSLKFECTKISF